MKKKLNLLWNLKFNFFSVAERPLTFFAYFLNAKKVGRRRLVIGPAKAGAFLFSHTRLPLSPRRGATTGQRGSTAGEMEPNGGKHRFLRSENRDEIEEVRGGEATRVQPATARATRDRTRRRLAAEQ